MTSEEFMRIIRGKLEFQSQLSVGKTLGVSQVSVSRWLSGDRKPSKTAILLAEKLWSGRKWKEFPRCEK